MTWNIRIDEIHIGILCVCFAIACLIVIYAANPEPFQVCTITADSEVLGNLDFNTEITPEFNALVSKLSINSVSGNVTVTAPCTWLKNQGGFS